MYIGEASKKSGATVKAIRLYEELGLLANIVRQNSYRTYTEEHIFIIKFIKIAQEFDFKLAELKDIIYPKGTLADWQSIQKAITLKEQNISNEITRLQKNQKELVDYNNEIKQCLIDNSDCLFPQNKLED